jgi:hypothetical protein
LGVAFRLPLGFTRCIGCEWPSIAAARSKRCQPSEWNSNSDFLPAMPKPNPDEEQVYAAVGRALSAWSHVEESLCMILLTATLPKLPGPSRIYLEDSFSAIKSFSAFWAIESFSAQLNMVDAAVKTRYANHPECLALWSVLYKRARSKNNLRNEMAHGTVMPFVTPVVETYFVPSFYKNLTADVMRFVNTDDCPAIKTPRIDHLDIRPAHRLTRKQVDERTRAFNMFKLRLDRFNERLRQIGKT